MDGRRSEHPEIQRVGPIPGSDLPIFPSSAEWPAVVVARPGDDPAALLALHLAQSPLPVVECDGDLRVTRWTTEAERLFGWRASEVVGRSLEALPLVHEADVTHVRQVLAAMHDGGSLRTVSRHRNRTRDGTLVYCEWYNSALCDEAGELRSLLSIIVDVTARVEAERRLRDANRRLDHTIEAMSDAYCVVGHDWRVLALNDAAARMSGVAKDEILGRDMWEVWPALLGSPQEHYFRRAITHGEAAVFELPYFEPPHRALVAEMRVFPIPEGMVTFARDLTEEWRARAMLEERDAAIERQLAELEAIYRDLPVGLCVIDTSLRFVRINERLAQLNGLPVDAHLGHAVRDILPGLQEVAETIIGRVLQTGEPVHDIEFTAETPAQPGTPRQWREHWRPIRNGAGTIVAVSVVVEDVTEPREAAAERERLLANEREARERAERSHEHARRLQAVTAALARALTPAEVATAVLTEGTAAVGATTGSLNLIAEDGDTVVTVASVGWEGRGLWQSYSLSQSGSAGFDAARSRELLHIESPEAYRARYPKVADAIAAAGLQASTVIPLEYGGRVQGILGFSWTAPRTLAEDERLLLLSIAGQCAQALERARLFEAERRSRAEAEEANRAKGDFLAIMSHELRTPLNAISGYVQLLEMGIRGPVSDPMRQDLARIASAGQHLLGLINSVLNFAKLEAGHVQFAIERVSVSELLTSVGVFVAPLAAAKGLELDVDRPPADLQVLADREKAMQVLVNLAGNAVKFTERGMVSISAHECDEAVEIVVRDTGQGIPPERLQGIFDPFVQVDARPGRLAEGIGLGLAISRDLARGMGGEIGVRSEIGRGSEFVVRLPRVR
jgi:PAS domain S-box-containing protein